MKRKKQSDLPPEKRNSRVFSIRLRLDHLDPNHANARHILDQVFSRDAKYKEQFMVRAINLGAGQDEILEPSEFMRELNQLSDNLRISQNNQMELIQDLNTTIQNLQQERALIRAMLAKFKQGDAIAYEQVANEVLDESEEVNPDLANSLFNLLEG